MWPADRPNPSYPKPSDLIQTMVRARKYLNVSQSDLADLRGVAASTQHQWETGADTRLSTVYGIAEALGVRLKISIETNQGMWFHVHPDLPNPMDASLSDQALSITEAIVELSDEKLPESTAKMIYALLLWSAAQHPDPVAEWTRQDIEMQYLADLPITPRYRLHGGTRCPKTCRHAGRRCAHVQSPSHGNDSGLVPNPR